ncbi:MAG: VCBS repeat-containing protein [Planctomycetes bacterium]|nr:VCBS repeat-containing protein [Planctomycetota bacterium]
MRRVFLIGVLASAAHAQLVYNPAPDWESQEPHTPRGVALVDLNRDGWLDLVVANHFTGDGTIPAPLQVFYNRGDGSFPRTADWQSADLGWNARVDVADVNGDGWPDVAVGQAQQREGPPAKLYLNINGTLSDHPAWTPKDYRTYSWGIAFGDMNNDGRPDLAVTGWPHLRVYLNVEGRLETSASWESREPPSPRGAVEWVDADGNGWLDLAQTEWLSATHAFGIHLNSAGRLSQRYDWNPGNPGGCEIGDAFAFGDLSADGIPDIVTAMSLCRYGSWPPGSLALHLGLETGLYAEPPNWRLPVLSTLALALADLDADGDLDMLVGGISGLKAFFTRSDVNGISSISPAWLSASSSANWDIAVGDIDNDGIRPVRREFGPAENQHLFYLGHQPIQGVTAVRRDGVRLEPSQYTVNRRNGWISVFAGPTNSLVVEYEYSDRWDLAVARSQNAAVFFNRWHLMIGDMNCDGAFNGGDVEPFLQALGDPAAYQAAHPNCHVENGDINCDGLVNGADLDLFFDCLVGSACRDCNANGLPDSCEGIGPLEIIAQPQNTGACLGERVILRVATNHPPVRYLWRKDGIVIPRATSEILVLDPITFADAGDYDVIVADACVTLFSDVTTVVVDTVPTIIAGPEDQTRCEGERVVFTVEASGPNLTYQWIKDFMVIPGATASTYVIESVTLADAGRYRARLRNGCGTLPSRLAVLSVPMGIYEHPASQTVCENDPVVLLVGASGPSLTYQWRKDGVEIPGATQNIYIIKAATLADAGVYDVVVTTSECAQVSDPATVIVDQCP